MAVEQVPSKLSIQKLQFMLQMIAMKNSAIKFFPIDGIYNNETLEGDIRSRHALPKRA